MPDVENLAAQLRAASSRMKEVSTKSREAAEECLKLAERIDQLALSSECSGLTLEAALREVGDALGAFGLTLGMRGTAELALRMLESGDIIYERMRRETAAAVLEDWVLGASESEAYEKSKRDA